MVPDVWFTGTMRTSGKKKKKKSQHKETKEFEWGVGRGGLGLLEVWKV